MGCGFPIAFLNKDNPGALQNDFLDQALASPVPSDWTSLPSTDQNLDSENVVNQPLPDAAQSSSTSNQAPSILSTGTLLAQNGYLERTGGALFKWAAAALAASLAAFQDTSQDISQFLSSRYYDIDEPTLRPPITIHTTVLEEADVDETDPNGWCSPGHTTDTSRR